MWRPSRAIGASIALHAAAVGLLCVRPAWWPLLLSAVVANHALLTFAVLSPRSRLLGPNLSRLPAGAGEAVGLTFDDGPDPAVTPRVLDILARAGVTASFFCIGIRARAHPTLVQAIAAAGHSVENHSLTHPLGFASRMPPGLRREVGGAQMILTSLAGRPARFFRAPFGFRSPALDFVLARAGLRHVAWTRRGYDTVCRDPAVVLRRLLRGVAAGDILLLHDGNGARTVQGDPVVLEVLPALLAALAARRLRPMSLPDAIDGAAAAEGCAARTRASGADASMSAADCPARIGNE